MRNRLARDSKYQARSQSNCFLFAGKLNLFLYQISMFKLKEEITCKQVLEEKCRLDTSHIIKLLCVSTIHRDACLQVLEVPLSIWQAQLPFIVPICFLRAPQCPRLLVNLYRGALSGCTGHTDFSVLQKQVSSWQRGDSQPKEVL